MKIVLEGADGTGKTTLANILAFKYGLTVCHCTQHDPGDYDFYYQAARKENTVWDRHTIGELIYPHIFGREPQISWGEAYDLIRKTEADGVKYFVLTLDEQELKARIAKRPNEHPKIVKNIVSINCGFKNWAGILHVPVIDTSKMTLNEIFSLMEEPNGKEI